MAIKRISSLFREGLREAFWNWLLGLPIWGVVLSPLLGLLAAWGTFLWGLPWWFQLTEFLVVVAVGIVITNEIQNCRARRRRVGDNPPAGPSGEPTRVGVVVSDAVTVTNVVTVGVGVVRVDSTVTINPPAPDAPPPPAPPTPRGEMPITESWLEAQMLALEIPCQEGTEASAAHCVRNLAFHTIFFESSATAFFDDLQARQDLSDDYRDDLRRAGGVLDATGYTWWAPFLHRAHPADRATVRGKLKAHFRKIYLLGAR